MIATVALSPEALFEVGGDACDQRAFGLQTERLTRALLDHAVLVYGTKPDKKRLIQQVKRLRSHNARAHQLWDVVLSELEKRARFCAAEPAAKCRLAGEMSASQFSEGWAGRVDLAVVCEATAISLGLDAGPQSLSLSGVDVAVAAHASQCETFQRLDHRLREQVLELSDPREKFWLDVLGPVLCRARRVVILDRYLFNGGLPAAAWILSRLDVEGRRLGVEVEILAETDSRGTLPVDAQDAAKCLLSAWQPVDGGRVRSVKLVTGTWQSGRKPLPHDRHISTDLGFGVEIPAGLCCFSDETVQRDEGVSWSFVSRKPGFDKLLRAEARVRDAAGRSTATAFEPSGTTKVNAHLTHPQAASR